MNLPGAMAAHAPYLERYVGSDPELRAIVATAVLAESGGRFDALGDFDPADGHPHSVGPFQLHDQGLGAGLSVAARQDPDVVYPFMVPHFRAARDRLRAQGYTGEELAVRAALAVERPRGWDDPRSAAWARYRAAYRQLVPETPDVRARVLAAAYALVGTPYGLPPGPGELDCALFVLRAFAEAGVPFPAGVRTAEQLRQACEPVTAEPDWDNAQVQRGDLLFFERTGGENPGERAGHVGFALLGGRMLDANGARGTVGETDLTGAWWQERLFEARRPPQYAGPAAAGAADPCAALRAELAAERAWGAALQADVIRRSREALEQALGARRLARARIREVVEWLRRHEA
jgi:cell wall-associated NlpC family hydrolase